MEVITVQEDSDFDEFELFLRDSLPNTMKADNEEIDSIIQLSIRTEKSIQRMSELGKYDESYDMFHLYRRIVQVFDRDMMRIFHHVRRGRFYLHRFRVDIFRENHEQHLEKMKQVVLWWEEWVWKDAIKLINKPKKKEDENTTEINSPLAYGLNISSVIISDWGASGKLLC